MIRQFRNYTTGLLSKLLMLLLAAAFVLWGIGDVFQGGARNNFVIRIGDEAITPQEFQQQMNLQLANYRELLGEDYSPELVKKLGLPRQVLSEMANRLLLQTEAKSLGLELSDATLMKIIRQNKSFLGPAGFDKDAFQAGLRSAGLTEESYLASLKSETATNLMLEPFDGSALVQRKALEAVTRLRGESRGAKLYLFSKESLGELKAPADKKLEAYYQENKQAFMLPEYRRVNVVTLVPQQLRASIEVDAGELRKTYESRKESLASPEKRKVSQLLYETKEQAAEAQKLIARGEAFEAVAKKLAPTNKELSLGFLTQAELMEEARAPVFRLEEGAVSSPLETSFGWHLFKVEAVKAPQIPAFDTVKESLTAEFVDSQLEDKLYNLSVEIEDRLAAGEKLEAVAKDLELKTATLDYFDPTGRTAEGKEVPLPPVKNLLARIFRPEEEAPSFQIGADENYYFVSLAGTKPAALPELKIVRDAVLAQWKEQTTARKLAEKVTKIAEALHKGDVAPLSNVAYRTQDSGPVKRDEEGEQDTALPRPLRQELFLLAEGRFSRAYPMDNGDWVIAKLTTVEPMQSKSLSDADLEALRNEFSEQYSEELVQGYLSYLSKKHPAEVNEAALNAVLR